MMKKAAVGAVLVAMAAFLIAMINVSMNAGGSAMLAMFSISLAIALVFFEGWLKEE